MSSILVLLLVLSTMTLSHGVLQNKFIKGFKCHINERLTKGCTKRFPLIRSLHHCLAKCDRDHMCIGGSLDDEGVCFLHETCSTSSSACTTADKHAKYWNKYCINGHVDPVTGKCKCENGASGLRCNTCPGNCKSVGSDFKGNEVRVYIDPDQDGKSPLKVVCQWRGSKYHFLVIAKNSGGFRSNRTWNEYIDGFYVDSNNYWLGLKSIHAFYNIPGVLMYLRLFYGESGKTECNYFSFKIKGSADHYAPTFMGVDICNGGGDNCFMHTKNVPFSTFDNDHDGDSSQNCAAASTSGWWYSPGCQTPCNLFSWGLDNWAGTPSHQRFRWPGIDLSTVPPEQIYMEMALDF